MLTKPTQKMFTLQSTSGRKGLIIVNFSQHALIHTLIACILTPESSLPLSPILLRILPPLPMPAVPRLPPPSSSSLPCPLTPRRLPSSTFPWPFNFGGPVRALLTPLPQSASAPPSLLPDLPSQIDAPARGGAARARRRGAASG